MNEYLKIKLLLCPVCSYSNHNSCSRRSDITEAQEACSEFNYNDRAEWIFYDECPMCETGGILMQDKFGAFCIMRECSFSQKYMVTEGENLL